MPKIDKPANNGPWPFVWAAALVIASLSAIAADDKLRVGVTLHPYYSFAKNIVQDRAEVVPLIGSNYNTHGYQPQPGDMKRAMTLDVLIVNGVGHDEWAFDILEAAQLEDELPLIYASEDVALIPVAGTGDDGETIINPHTFISVTATVPQLYTIAEALANLDPPNASFYLKNARNYAGRLRRIKASYLEKVAEVPTADLEVATVHGGYDYLLQEFGLTVAAVIEPSHGAKPTASQLRDTIDRINALDVDIIFSELQFPEKYVETIQEATGIEVSFLSHMTQGEYSAESFEKSLRTNMEAVVAAVRDAAKAGGGDE